MAIGHELCETDLLDPVPHLISIDSEHRLSPPRL
jgi:hypothetical protein